MAADLIYEDGRPYLEGPKQINEYFEGFDYDEVVRILIPLMYSALIDREVISLNENYTRYIKYAKKKDGQYFSHEVQHHVDHLNHEAYKYSILYLLQDPTHYTNEKLTYDITTRKIAELVYKLLDIKEGDSLYDLGSGIGAMLGGIFDLSTNDGKGITLYGSDIDQEAIDMCDMIITLLSVGKTSLNCFSGDAIKERPYSYNKGYVFPPIGERFFFKETKFQSALYPDINLAGSFYEQWIYIDALLANLKGEDSRAVALVYGRSLLLTDQNTYLQRLLDDGWIEGIIELPSSSLMSTSTKPFLIVFSHENKKVRFIYCDSEEFIIPSKGNKKYVDLNSDAILDAYFNVKGTCSRVVDNKDLKDKLNWHPSSMPYALDNQNNKSYIPLKEVAQIQTATVATAISFDIVDEDTGYKIITASDIDDSGIKWDDLKSVKMKDDGFDKFMVHEGDVIVTSKTTKIKVAVVDHEPKEKAILTGGMMRTRPDQTRLNPYYLKMYLDSEEGKELLRSMSGGTTILHLGPSMFMGLKVPVIDINKQNKKADLYLEKVRTINSHKDIIKGLEQEINILINDKED